MNQALVHITAVSQLKSAMADSHAWRINLEVIKRVVVEGKSAALVIRDGRKVYRITIGHRALGVLSRRLFIAAHEISRRKN